MNPRSNTDSGLHPQARQINWLFWPSIAGLMFVIILATDAPTAALAVGLPSGVAFGYAWCLINHPRS
jgi:hypothetical protein